MEKDSFMEILQVAWDKRSDLHNSTDVDAYRFFHGFTEGIPGLCLDRYSDTCIILQKKEIPLEERDLVDGIQKVSGNFFRRIVLKADKQKLGRKACGAKYLVGEAGAMTDFVQEYGLKYYYDPESMHTNGFYLDARPARRWIAENSKDRRVLNLFAHTGSLGVCAKAHGATEIVHVDKSKIIVQKIRTNYELNNLAPDDRGFLHGDLYFHLPRAIKSSQKFSAIILDPPPRVPTPPKVSKHRPKGQDFRTLIEMTCQLLDQDAWLLCLYHGYHQDHDAYDNEIILASEGLLTPFWHGHSDSDFPELEPNRKTRMTAFNYRAKPV